MCHILREKSFYYIKTEVVSEPSSFKFIERKPENNITPFFPFRIILASIIKSHESTLF